MTTTKRRYAFCGVAHIARKDDATMMREVTERAPSIRQKMSSNTKWKMRAFLRRFILRAQSSRACFIEVMHFHISKKKKCLSWGQNESESVD